MIEVWADKAEPAVRLLVAKGAGLPFDLGPRDWLLVGPYEPSPDEARQIETLGFCFIQSDEPVPDPEKLKNSGAAGQ